MPRHLASKCETTVISRLNTNLAKDPSLKYIKSSLYPKARYANIIKKREKSLKRNFAEIAQCGRNSRKHAMIHVIGQLIIDESASINILLHCWSVGAGYLAQFVKRPDNHLVGARPEDIKRTNTETTMPIEEGTKQKIEGDRGITSKDMNDNLKKNRKTNLPNKLEL
ncbi:hypothetical protein JHK87_050013 [Glycine soja]|nr:hypothetical protein JHK87_050013 [Glycine soja]